MFRRSSYNYSDMTPDGMRDFNLVNAMDLEEFELFGVATVYYPLNIAQENYDDVYRDLLSSKEFKEPIQLRTFFKVDESTEHGMSEIGVGQIAERNGNVWVNITKIENLLNRVPIVGDVVENNQLHQKFEIFKISKETHRIGRPIRYKLSVRLYQDTL